MPRRNVVVASEPLQVVAESAALDQVARVNTPRVRIALRQAGLRVAEEQEVVAVAQAAAQTKPQQQDQHEKNSVAVRFPENPHQSSVLSLSHPNIA